MSNSLMPDHEISDSTQHNFKFIADAMLGRLARWLRFLGFDVLYERDISDNMLIKIAREQGRSILTRDTRLVKRRGLGHFLLIQSDDPFRQLAEVLGKLNLRHYELLSRCVKCNGLLTRIADKHEIEGSVPEHVFLHFPLFMKCNNCGRIYWKGTHPEKFIFNLQSSGYIESVKGFTINLHRITSKTS
jgi:uncharacterized protein